MKKTKNNIVYGSWQNRERHTISNIWRDNTKGWLCTKCGLTVIFRNDKNDTTLYPGGRCLFASEVETKTDWASFALVLIPMALLGLLGFSLIVFVA